MSKSCQGPTVIIFVPATTSMERVNVQTSNLVRRLIKGVLYPKIAKNRSSGCVGRSGDLLSNFGILSVSISLE